jgi:hypothetical protein
LPHEFLIEAHPIPKDHIGNRALALIVAMRLDGDFFPEGKVRGGVLDLLPISLALFRTVDVAESNAFCMVAVQDFDRVAVEDGDNGSVKSDTSTAEKEEMKKPNVAIRRSPKTNRDKHGKSCTRGRRQMAKS